jgi:hypothetical protein
MPSVANNTIVLSVAMLSVIMMIVIMVIVVAPRFQAENSSFPFNVTPK